MDQSTKPITEKIITPATASAKIAGPELMPLGDLSDFRVDFSEPSAGGKDNSEGGFEDGNKVFGDGTKGLVKGI
jgi:hypothetical protein